MYTLTWTYRCVLNSTVDIFKIWMPVVLSLFWGNVSISKFKTIWKIFSKSESMSCSDLVEYWCEGRRRVPHTSGSAAVSWFWWHRHQHVTLHVLHALQLERNVPHSLCTTHQCLCYIWRLIWNLSKIVIYKEEFLNISKTSKEELRH